MSNPNQGAATRARNEEIERRLTAGESGPALARAFGITQPRVFQIARAVREARGEVAPRAKPKPQASTIRPRLRKGDHGLWYCGDAVLTRAGETPKAAYDLWLTAAIAAALPKPRAPAAAPFEPLPPYTGPVTVVAGTKVAPRALAMTPAMRFAMERAGLAQRPIRSLAGA